jgi:hypothetical protein
MGDWQMQFGIYAFNGFHLLFTVSILLRLVAAVHVSRIQEPHVYETLQVVTSLIGVTPLRVMRYPIGLYRSISARMEPVRMKSRKTVPQERPAAAIPQEVPVGVE